jgi:hypothetical protein
MSIQRPSVLPPTSNCVCGNQPKAYCTDGKLYHVECYKCKIVTPRLRNKYNAVSLFEAMCEAVIMDEKHPILSLIRSNTNGV